MNQLKVERRHREAAWPIRPENYGLQDRDAWMAGVYDFVITIQAFSRFEASLSDGWRDIASAEVEGYEQNPRVLVWADGAILTAQYAPNNCGDGSYSWFADKANGGFCCEVEPTHWRPLPAPPTDTGQASGGEGT